MGPRFLSKLALIFIFGLPVILASAIPGSEADTNMPSALPNWLEPRALNIVELVGQVPDSYLQGAIISYDNGEGILVYENGHRSDTVIEITVTLYPRVTYPDWLHGAPLTSFGCLGQPPRYDHMGSVVSESFLHLTDSRGNDVTSQIDYMYITTMGTLQPMVGTAAYHRYPEECFGCGGKPPIPSLTNDGLPIPSNSGCNLLIPGHDYYPLTGVFTLYADEQIEARVVGTETGDYQTYIGGGSVGIFEPLMDQLQSQYPNRHNRVGLSIPAEANYLLVKYPPMAGDPYTDNYSGAPFNNGGRFSSGTHRVGFRELSTDRTFGGLFPIDVVWLDADKADGEEFLPVFNPEPKLATPEYILPDDIPYNSCFTEGNCSSSIIEEINNALMPLEIIYFKVEKPDGNLQATPLQIPGKTWSPSRDKSNSQDQNSVQRSINLLDDTHYMFLPLMVRSEPTCSEYPCGWFDDMGRMLGYLSAP